MSGTNRRTEKSINHFHCKSIEQIACILRKETPFQLAWVGPCPALPDSHPSRHQRRTPCGSLSSHWLPPQKIRQIAIPKMAGLWFDEQLGQFFPVGLPWLNNGHTKTIKNILLWSSRSLDPGARETSQDRLNSRQRRQIATAYQKCCNICLATTPIVKRCESYSTF